MTAPCAGCGLLGCERCGANYAIADAYNYACGTHTNGAHHACRNRRRFRREGLEQSIFDGMIEMLSTPAAEAQFVRETKANVAAHDKAQSADAADRTRRLGKVEKEIANLVAAVCPARPVRGCRAGA
jgi:hypothetical protein